MSLWQSSLESALLRTAPSHENEAARRWTWSDLDDVRRVLSAVGVSVGSYEDGGITDASIDFPPGSGTFDHTEVTVGPEPGTVYFADGRPGEEVRPFAVVRPAELTFVLPQGSDGHPAWAWGYLWLTLAPLASALGRSSSRRRSSESRGYEEVCEVRPGEYVERGWWDEGTLPGGRPLPDGARPLIRYLRGDLLTVCKGGPYNLLGLDRRMRGHDDRGAYHELLGKSQFEGFVTALAKREAWP